MTSTRLLATAAMVAVAAFAVTACKKKTDVDGATSAMSDAPAPAAPATPDAAAPMSADASAMSASSAAPMSGTGPNSSGRDGDITPQSSSTPG